MSSAVPAWLDRLSARLAGPLPGREAQQRAEPPLSCGRHFDPPPDDARRAAVMLLLYPAEGRWHLPLVLRPETLPLHAGQIGLPGGMIEPGEDAWAAALRELDEELGVPPAGVRPLGRLSPLHVFVSGTTIQPWVGCVERAPAWRPSPDEVAEVIELSLATLTDGDSWQPRPRVERGIPFTAAHLIVGRHAVWGATAMILAELAAVVGECS
jgi:8-oxo-dGTP pyrophosphatase MutT (NUDIX family)